MMKRWLVQGAGGVTSNAISIVCFCEVSSVVITVAGRLQ
jgi:hypothetical protein